MSKLTDFYGHKTALEQGSEFSGQNSMQWDILEDKLIREDLMPRLMQKIAPLLKEVQSPMSININYSPKGMVSMTFTRSCITDTFQLDIDTTQVLPDVEEEQTEMKDDTNIMPAPTEQVIDEDDDDEEDDIPELEMVIDTPTEAEEPARKRKKSIPFSVTFPDGETIYEKNSITTFIRSLEKIGLRKIYKGNHGVEHKGYKIVGTVPYHYKENEQRTKKQEKIGEYYIFTHMSNAFKYDDLFRLCDYFGITIEIHEITEDGPNLVQRDTAKEQEPEVVKSITGNTIQDQFLSFLEQRISADSARGYMRHLNNGVRQFIKLIVDDKADSIFSFTTSEEVDLCIELLEENADYIAENERLHHYFSAALKQWRKFIATREI